MKNSWKTLSSKLLYKNKFVTLHKKQVIQPDGRKGEYPIIKRRPAVVVVPLEKDGITYLVRQFRYTLGKVTLEFPAGYIEDKESPLTAAKRELAEEVGLSAKNWKKMGEMYITGSIFNAKHIYYLATDLTKTLSNPEPTEEITIEKYPFREVENMVFEEKFDISSSVVAILLADRLIKKGKT